MKTLPQNCILMWTQISEGALPQFQEASFDGSLEEAVATMQLRANRGEFLLGQVLEADGKVFKNIVSDSRPAKRLNG